MAVGHVVAFEGNHGFLRAQSGSRRILSSLPLWEGQGLSAARAARMENSMNIGQAAAASGVSAKMIRHYESVGLFPQAPRTESGYRQYSQREVGMLRFIRHARDLGFPSERIRELLGLWQNRRRPSRQVRALAQAQLEELDRKLQEVQAMKAALEHLIDGCHGDDRPDCPIIDTLAEERAVVPPSAGGVNTRSATAGLRPQKRAPGRVVKDAVK